MKVNQEACPVEVVTTPGRQCNRYDHSVYKGCIDIVPTHILISVNTAYVTWRAGSFSPSLHMKAIIVSLNTTDCLVYSECYPKLGRLRVLRSKRAFWCTCWRRALRRATTFASLRSFWCSARNAARLKVAGGSCGVCEPVEQSSHTAHWSPPSSAAPRLVSTRMLCRMTHAYKTINIVL